MDPLNSDSSSFTWSALNGDDGDSPIIIGSGSSSRPGTGSSSGSDDKDTSSSSGSGGVKGVRPFLVLPTTARPSPQASRPTALVTSIRSQSIVSSSAVASSSSSAPFPVTRSSAASTSTSLSPSALSSSISSALASLSVASSLSASLPTPSNGLNGTDTSSAGDSAAPLPLKHNTPLLLLLVLGCLVGAATIMASLAWLCRMSDSRKRAKKKARLNQASWDPDASSSVFDDAASSPGMGGGGVPSLLGAGVRDRGTGSGASGGGTNMVQREGKGASSGWWMLGEGDKRVSSPSLMEYDYDEKFESEREEGNGIYIDSNPVPVPAAVALDPGGNRRGNSTRRQQHQQRPGSILGGFGLGARPLPNLVRGLTNRASHRVPLPQAFPPRERNISAHSQFTLPALAFQDEQETAAPPLPSKRTSSGMARPPMADPRARKESKRFSAGDITAGGPARTGSVRNASRRSTQFGPNPYLDVIAATPSLVSGCEGLDMGSVIEHKDDDPYTSLPARQSHYRHSFVRSNGSGSGQPNRSGRPLSSQDPAAPDLLALATSHAHGTPLLSNNGGSGVGGGGRDGEGRGMGTPIEFQRNNYDPFARLGTPGPGGGGAILDPFHSSMARTGTPVLSPLLNQIMHPAGMLARPGTPSSLMAGRSRFQQGV